jgi:uncharacterized caspase-like protein
VRLPDSQRSRVVLIGTGRYADEKLPDLPVVRRTISDLAAAFTDPVHGVVIKNNCTVLEDQADIRLIGDALRSAARQAVDLLLVYFVGHGLVAGRRHELYLGLPDSQWAEPEFNSLEYEKLRSAVLDSAAATKIIILDCCFSGRVVSEAMADPVTEMVGQIEVDGTYVLASAGRDQVALIQPGEAYTAFTGRFLQLLHNGVPGGPELLTVDYLYQQLVAKMRAEGLSQPQKRATSTADLLALAANRAFAAAQTARTLLGTPTTAGPPTPDLQARQRRRPRSPGHVLGELPDPGRSQAVLIGASTYRHLEDLPAVCNNLSGFRDVLIASALGGLPADHCTVVAEPAKPVDVYRALSEQAAAAEDTLLVYFAGHARPDSPNELYLCLPDTDPDALRFTALPYDLLRRAVADSPAIIKVVILDFCCSGRPLADPAEQTADEEAIVGQVGIERTFVLTAIAANAVALAPPGERYTVFTGALLDLLTKGIPDGPELITLEEILPRLEDALRRRRLPLPHGQGNDIDMRLALTRNLALPDRAGPGSSTSSSPRSQPSSATPSQRYALPA